MLAVALSAVFSSAMKGRCDARPDLAERAIPLTVRIPTLACRAGVELVTRLFAPLGWTVEAFRCRWIRTCRGGATPATSTPP